MKAIPDIIERLEDLHKQATVERSHFYVGSCVVDAIDEIRAMRLGLQTLMRAIEAEGFSVMADIIRPGQLTLERRA